MTDVAESGLRRFRSYPAYKDSGVEWLGEMPAHWWVKPLKFAVKMNPDDLSDSTPDDFRITYVDIGSVTQEKGITWTEEYDFLNAPSRARRRVREGDTIISTVRTYLKAVAAIQNPPDNMVVSTGFAVLRPSDGVIANFLSRAVQSDLFISRVVSLSEGVGYPAIAPSTLARIDLWLPPTDEQVAIAAFLDRETARIDELVAKKERLIELLQEKRAALITRAVTKGLDPNVPMKDSGVEWLGKIPANWEENRLKHLIRGPLKYGANEAAESRDMTWPRFVRITDITESGDLREDTFYSLPPDVASAYILDDGDVLFARSGATVGKSFLYRSSWGQCCYAGYLIRARIDRSKMTDEFFRYFSSSRAYWDQIYSSLIQATIQNVSAEKYANLWLRVPPVGEQRGIVSFLDRETARIDARIAKVNEAIERLKEYRTALISAAVTGKIDVRENVA
jgi:type I restriction enzyme, S subunit